MTVECAHCYQPLAFVRGNWRSHDSDGNNAGTWCTENVGGLFHEPARQAGVVTEHDPTLPSQAELAVNPDAA